MNVEKSNSKFLARIEQMRRRLKKIGMPLYRLAEAAGLSERATQKFNSPDWNPTLNTLVALEAALFDEESGK